MSVTQTHFELFDLPVSFDLDLQEVNQRYRDLQKTVHPDRFVNAGDRERRLSVEKAALINDAFQVLKSPQLRARYMLELQGVEFDDERDTAVDPMFLIEQIELREALGELDSTADPVSALNDIMRDIKKRIEVVITKISEILKNDTLDAEEKSEAKQWVQKMRFLNRLQQEAESKEEALLEDY